MLLLVLLLFVVLAFALGIVYSPWFWLLLIVVALAAVLNSGRLM